MAGSLLLSSVSVVSNRFSSSWRQYDYHYIKRFQRKKYIFNCQRITNSTSNEFPHFIIEGSCSWASKIPTQSLLDQRKLILSPSRRNQEDTLATDLITFKQNARKLVEVDEGIGITKYLKGKKFLITGATGFLAKVLIEKILRTVPDVGKIFLLIKAKSEKAAIERMQNEIIDTELFKYLREAHGENYHVFMRNKLVPVVGNVGEDNLGIQSDLGTQIEEEVDFIVNSAANTAFDERYDVSLDVNTVGPCKLMIFAKRCKKLKLFLHVSTAYVNGQRQGIILEKPFSMGESIATERSESEILQLLDIEAELKLASESRQSSTDNEVTQNMKELGLKRAKKYGWQDTYVFTKAMGEMMIDSMRGDIPVVIIRPSVIESTIQEPFPGWMEGNRMMDPIVLYYGKGQLTGFLVDPKGVLDVVPADMVINATLAAIAKYGRSSKPNMSIYHISSSVTNPLMFQNLARLLFEHFSSSPFTDTKGIKIQVPKMKLFHSMDDFSSHIWNEATQRCQKVTPTDFHGKLSQRLQNICKKSVEQAKYLANIYQPYTFYGGRFDNTNTCKLLAELSDWERENFNFDVRSIDWDDYISNIHIPGLRRHVMKGRGMKVKT